MNSTYKKNIKNSYYSVADVIFLPLMMIVSVPMLIDKLGADQYGMWILINSIVASLGKMNIGGADAIIKYISYYRSKKNHLMIQAVFTASISVYIAIVSIILTISLLGIYLFEYGIFSMQSINIKYIDSLKLGIVFVGFVMLEQIVYSYFKGYERYDISARISIISKFIIIAIQLVTAFQTGSLHQVFLNMILISPFLLFAEILILKRFNNISIKIKYDPKTIKEVYGFGLWSWVYTILGIVSSQFDKWIVGYFFGLEILGFYGISSLIFSQIHMVLASSVSWIFPKVSKEGIRSNSSIKFFYKIQLVLVMTGCVISVFLFYFNNIFSWWLGTEGFKNSVEYIKPFLILIAINSPTISTYFYLNGGGYIKYNVIYKLATVISELSFSFFLYPYYGVFGIILALGITTIIFSTIQRIILYRYVFNNKSIANAIWPQIPGFIIGLWFFITQTENIW